MEATIKIIKILEGNGQSSTQPRKRTRIIMNTYIKGIIFLAIFLCIIINGTFAQFILNNKATVIPGFQSFQLTPAANSMGGSVWDQYKADLTQPFTISGKMFFGKASQTNGADGIVFVFQNYCLNAGSIGGGIGYKGLKGQSIGIEVDTYQNILGTGDQNNNDPPYDHIAFDQQGVVIHDSLINAVFPTPVQASPTKTNVKDSLWHYFKVDWNSASMILSMYFDDSIIPRTQISYDIVKNVFTGNPFAYWGFTSSTGGKSSPNSVRIDKLINLTDYLRDTIICRGDTVKSVSLPIYHDTLTNIAFKKPCNASADSSGAHLAFDSNSATRWSSATKDDQYIMVDLKNTYHITRITLNWEAAYGAKYLLQVSNDSINWTTIENQTSGIGGLEVFYFKNIVGRYVRLQGIKRGTGYGYSLWDFTIFGEAVYEWTPNTNIDNVYSSTPKFYPITSTTYTYQMIDNCGVIYKDSIKIDVHGPLTTFTTKNISCKGDGDGSLAANVSSGLAPFTYLWNTGSTLTSISGLSPTSYTLTVTDAKNCISINNALISEPDLLTLSLTPKNSDCNAIPTGAITANPLGGSTPYNYVWEHLSSTSSVINNLSSANYNVTVTDNNGCTVNSSQVITEPDPIVISLSSTNANCFNSNDGSITASVSGGVIGAGSYSYLWDKSSSTTASIQNLINGDYTVSVNDANGCVKTATAIITQPIDISLNPSQIDISCKGRNDGSITLNPTGGTGINYGYLWGDASTNNLLTGLKDSSYTVTVTDANSCSKIATITITSPQPILINPAITNASCNAIGNGSIALTPTGGNGSPFTYLWNNLSTDQTLNAVLTGKFIVTVTDAKGCDKVSDSLIVQEASTIVVSPLTKDVTCNGDATGSIKLNAGGGTGNFNYIWDDASSINSPDRFALKIGTYTVTLTDANNCTVSKTIVISQPDSLKLVVNIMQAKCFGQTTSVELIPENGTPPYIFNFKGTNSTGIFTNLVNGKYMPILIDANGCNVNSNEVTITSPTEMTTESILVNDKNAKGEGSISLIPSGGAPPYLYKCENCNASVNNNNPFLNLYAGDYTILITDKNNCVLSKTYTLINIPGELVIPNIFSPNGDNKNDYFTISNLEQYTNVTLDIFNRWGNPITTIENFNISNHWDGYAANGELLSDGVYFYVLKLGDSGVLNGTVTIVK